MDEIRRYRHAGAGMFCGSHARYRDEHPSDEYVLASDYDALQAELDHRRSAALEGIIGDAEQLASDLSKHPGLKTTSREVGDIASRLSSLTDTPIASEVWVVERDGNIQQIYASKEDATHDRCSPPCVVTGPRFVYPVHGAPEQDGAQYARTEDAPATPSSVATYSDPCDDCADCSAEMPPEHYAHFCDGAAQPVAGIDESGDDDPFCAERCYGTTASDHAACRAERSDVGKECARGLLSHRKRGSAHYQHGEIEPIEYIFAQGLGEAFCSGNVIKYVTRYRHSRHGLDDLIKARHYIDMLIERMEAADED